MEPAMRVSQDGTILCSLLLYNPSCRRATSTPTGNASSLATALLGNHVHHTASTPTFSHQTDLQKSSAAVTCQKCGEKFVKWESLEAHHLSKHAGDSLVEIISRTGWSKTDRSCRRIERVLKVHNTPESLARF
ncbi:unnamed protein product [Musa banksii]